MPKNVTSFGDLDMRRPAGMCIGENVGRYSRVERAGFFIVDEDHEDFVDGISGVYRVKIPEGMTRMNVALTPPPALEAPPALFGIWLHDTEQDDVNTLPDPNVPRHVLELLPFATYPGVAVLSAWSVGLAYVIPCQSCAGQLELVVRYSDRGQGRPGRVAYRMTNEWGF